MATGNSVNMGSGNGLENRTCMSNSMIMDIISYPCLISGSKKAGGRFNGRYNLIKLWFSIILNPACVWSKNIIWWSVELVGWQEHVCQQNIFRRLWKLRGKVRWWSSVYTLKLELMLQKQSFSNPVALLDMHKAFKDLPWPRSSSDDSLGDVMIYANVTCYPICQILTTSAECDLSTTHFLVDKHDLLPCIDHFFIERRCCYKTNPPITAKIMCYWPMWYEVVTKCLSLALTVGILQWECRGIHRQFYFW